MKLLIAVPTLDYMHVDFVKSLMALTARLKDDGVPFDLELSAGTLVYRARDNIACKAINEGYTHVLWLDADMVFKPGILDDLLFCGKPFVTGICHSRRKPFTSCLFKNIDLNSVERYGDEYPTEPFEVAGCGFACVLIETAILRDVQMTEGTCFTPLVGYGEDIAFCKRARARGYKIFADPTVRVGHIGHLVVYPDDVKKYRDDIVT